MDIYRRIALIRNEDDSNEMLSELIDRYGDPPAPVIALTSIAMLRSEASLAGVTEISQREGWLRLKLAEFNLERVSTLHSQPEYKGNLRVLAGGTEPAIALKLQGHDVVEDAVKFVRAFAAAAAPASPVKS
ncbi:MAG: hypothetical protein FWF44_09435 [Defluviitaleaceae bacterium]|nr:hypothetical protein [Defluviitaleaceae bacterium]